MKNHYQTLTTEKRLWEKYGLSQQDMADYLGISLSLLKRVETGDRNLPTAASLKMLAITVYDATLPASAKTETHKPAVEPTINEDLQMAVRKCKLQLFTTQRKLKAVQLRYRAAECLLALSNFLLQQATDEGDQLWLKLQQRLAAKKLQHTEIITIGLY